MVSLYMPAKHRACLAEFVARTRAAGSLAQYTEHLRRREADAGGGGGGGGLEFGAGECVEALRDAVAALGELRSFHLGVATRYLRATSSGTGGSTFREMLAETIEDTRRAEPSY